MKNASHEPANVLIVCQFFYPELISTGQTVTEMAEELTRQGIKVHVLCGYPTLQDTRSEVPPYSDYNGISVTRVRMTRFPKANLFGRIVNQLTFAWAVFRYLLLHRFERPRPKAVIAFTNPPFLGAVCGLLRLLKRIPPFIYVMFDVYPDSAIRLGFIRPYGIIAAIWHMANAFSYRQARFIVTLGRCMTQRLEQRLSARNRRKIRMIPVWGDDELIRTTIHKAAEEGKTGADNPFRKQFGTTGRFAVLYSGNMARFHDMETIMEAAFILKDEPDIVFIFVGGGHKRAWCEGFAAEHGLSNCQFYDYVARPDLPLLLESADAGLVSLIAGQEGLSVPSKTYGLFAAGLPVIAVMPAHGEIARVITEEHCGAVVQNGDGPGLALCIKDLRDHAEKRNAMGQRSDAISRAKYGLTASVRHYVELLNA